MPGFAVSSGCSHGGSGESGIAGSGASGFTCNSDIPSLLAADLGLLVWTDWGLLQTVDLHLLQQSWAESSLLPLLLSNWLQIDLCTWLCVW